MNVRQENLTAVLLDATDAEYEWLQAYLTFEDPGARFSGAPSTYRLTDRNGSFPAGLLAMVSAAAAKEGFTLGVTDARVAPPGAVVPGPPGWAPHELDWLRDYQLEGVRLALLHKRGILWMPTGSGKTECAVGLAKLVRERWLFVVHRETLVEQAAVRFEMRTGEPAGRIAAGQWIEGRFTCATFQALHAARESGRCKALLAGTVGLLVDEAHTVAAGTFWGVAQSAANAYYRIGLSGTPLDRGDRRSVFTVGALGPVIYRIKPELLISRGVIARPTIRMVPHRHSPMMEGPQRGRRQWAKAYTAHIAANTERNRLLIGIAQAAAKPSMIFVQHIAHGRALTKVLRAGGLNVDMVDGSDKEHWRQSRLADLEAGNLDAIVCTSLPYNELILVRAAGAGAQLMEIGAFVERAYPQGAWEVWTKLADGQDGWAAVTGVTSHPIGNEAVVESALRGGARVLTTTNHSLIGPAGERVPPRVGGVVAQAMTAPNDPASPSIDVCSALYQSEDAALFEVHVSGVTQAGVRRMWGAQQLLAGVTAGERRTDARRRQWVDSLGATDDAVRTALDAYFQHVKYHKGAYRMEVPASTQELAFLETLQLGARVYKKWSASRMSLPLQLDITPALARLAGMFVAEGCLVRHARGARNPIMRATFSAIESPAVGASEGSIAKAAIRDTYKEALRAALGWEPNENVKQLNLQGAVPYALFAHVLGVGGKAADKRTPAFVWGAPADVRTEYLWGYFLGDGHLAVPGRKVVWTTISRHLAVGTYWLLLGLGHAVSLAGSMRVPSAHTYRGQEITARHRRYDVICRSPIFGFACLQEKRWTTARPSAATIARVLSQKDQPRVVYDISVAGVERFYAGAGVLCHNTVFQEGVDVPCLLSVINAAGGKAAIPVVQRMGRGMRMAAGKDTFEVWDIWDTGDNWMDDHSTARRRAYHREGHPVHMGELNGPVKIVQPPPPRKPKPAKG